MTTRKPDDRVEMTADALTRRTVKVRPQTAIPSAIEGYTLHLWMSPGGRIRYVYLETGKLATTAGAQRTWTELTLERVGKNESLRKDATAILLWVLAGGHPLPEVPRGEGD